jgi:hypothetical protein
MEKINFKSHWYKNCKRQRKAKAKICSECPFRDWIEIQEVIHMNTAEVKKWPKWKQKYVISAESASTGKFCS